MERCDACLSAPILAEWLACKKKTATQGGRPVAGLISRYAGEGLPSGKPAARPGSGFSTFTSGSPLAEPFDGPFGRTFGIADPDGYRITVYEKDQPLFWPPKRSSASQKKPG